MIDPGATFVEVWGDIVHADWCTGPDPENCGGECETES